MCEATARLIGLGKASAGSRATRLRKVWATRSLVDDNLRLFLEPQLGQSSKGREVVCSYPGTGWQIFHHAISCKYFTHVTYGLYYSIETSLRLFHCFIIEVICEILPINTSKSEGTGLRKL